jgi:hypothetical protein
MPTEAAHYVHVISVILISPVLGLSILICILHKDILNPINSSNLYFIHRLLRVLKCKNRSFVGSGRPITDREQLTPPNELVSPVTDEGTFALRKVVGIKTFKKNSQQMMGKPKLKKSVTKYHRRSYSEEKSQYSPTVGAQVQNTR